MGRRKALQTLQLQSGLSLLGESSDNICTQEWLNDIYRQAQSEIRPVRLYATTTEHQINRIKGLFEQYCELRAPKIDPRRTLEACEAAQFVTFLHWLCKNFTIKKTNTVITYWRQLSQIHIVWFRRRMDPFIMKEIYAFIEGPLTDLYGLDDTENETFLLEAEEFDEVIKFHWVADVYIYPLERQRVQVPTILILAGVTASRPDALLHIRYRDLNLYVEKDEKTGQYLPRLEVTLAKTKSGKKRQRPKTYVLNLDDNPLFCPVTHIIVLAFDDKAYAPPDLVSPQQLFRLKVRPGQGRQPIPWKREMLAIPVFRRTLRCREGFVLSPDKPLTYGVYHPSVVRLGEALGFVEILKTYCLRKGQGNNINDDPNSSDAVRNLVLDHVGNRMFERNYISRRIRYNTQDVFWGRTPDHESAKVASRIGRLRDTRRPRKLNEEQKREVRLDPVIVQLSTTRGQLRDQIVKEFGAVQMAIGEPIHKDYERVTRMHTNSIKAKERAKLKQIRETYDLHAPINEIQRQLRGDGSDGNEEGPEPRVPPIKLEERRRIAEFAVGGASRFTGQNGFEAHVEFCLNAIALCKRRECRDPRPTKRQNEVPEAWDDGPLRVAEVGTRKMKRTEPMKCLLNQCIFCLLDEGLSTEDARRSFERKWTLQRHMDRWHLKDTPEGERIPCPDTEACGGVMLRGVSHVKNHAVRVHSCNL
ncbi:hypothetical protein CLAIMM_15173 [Cladophialophora immunda]|nr:hypothetical protein CLAIMM_15173 [Cladophialophora immunda]